MSESSEASPTGDPIIAQSEEAAVDADKAKRAANLFDLRRLIGGLFVVYGVILFILGLGASEAEKQKAAGWNLNLSVGIAMLIVGALFLVWAFARPLSEELGESAGDERT
jgi:membrane protease YdiL (CAAX protease family)